MARINKSDLEYFYDNNLHIESRTLYLGGDIDDVTAADIVKGMHILQRISQDTPVTIIMNSHGGEEENGYAIYDAIKSAKCPTIGVVAGQASSMCSIILQACTTRLAYPNATVMVHDGDAEVEGGAVAVENEGQYSKASRWKMYRIYEARSGKSAKYWDKKCKSDYVMTAKEALKEGMIDEVIDG